MGIHNGNNSGFNNGDQMNQQNQNNGNFFGGNTMNARAYSPSSFFGRSMAPDINDGNIHLLAQQLNDSIGKHSWNEGELGSSMRFHAVSAATIGQSVSSVVAVARVGNDAPIFVVRTILCYAGEESYPVRKINQGRETFERRVRASDAINGDYWAAITQKYIPKSASQVLSAGVVTVNTNSFDIKDEAAIERLMQGTATAIMDVYQTEIEQIFYDLPSFVQQGMRLKVVPTISNDPYVTESGRVVRADIQVPWYVSAEQYGSESTQEELGRVCGYIELNPLQPKPTFGVYQQNAMPEPYYEAVFVITHNGPTKPQAPCTIELYLLSLLGAYLTTADNFWMGTFQPNLGNQSDIHSLAGLGYHSDAHEAFTDIDSNSTDAATVEMLLSKLLLRPENCPFPTPAFAIDLDPSDDRSGVVSLMLAAADGSPVAQQKIIEAVDKLTRGKFSQFFKADQPIFDTGYSMISIGEYVDGHGVRRDSRDYGTLAVLNLTQGNMVEFSRYAATMDQGIDSPDIQMARRDAIFRPVAQINNYAYAARKYMNPDFFVAFQKAAAQAGVEPRVEGVGYRNNHSFVGAASGRIVGRPATFNHGGVGAGPQSYGRFGGGFGTSY